MALPGYDKLRTLTQGDDADFDVYYRRVPSGQRIVSAILAVKLSAADAERRCYLPRLDHPDRGRRRGTRSSLTAARR
jgi:hypothetical protein